MNKPKWTDIATVGLTFLGLVFLIIEVVSIRESLEILRENQLEEKKPQGTVITTQTYMTEEGEVTDDYLVLDTVNCANDEFTMRFSPWFGNDGKDHLVYLGGVAMYTNYLLDLREKILSSSPEIRYPNLKYGFTTGFMRENWLHPQLRFRENFVWYRVTHANEYYIHSIYYYTDLLGNLYDTENLCQLELKEKIYINGRMYPEVDNRKFKSSFHTYNKEEAKKVYNYFASAPSEDNHAQSLASCIEKTHTFNKGR